MKNKQPKRGQRLLSALTNAHWAMRPDALSSLIDVSEYVVRNGVDPKSLATGSGEPMEGTYDVEVRDGVAIIPITGPLFRYANLMTAWCGATSYQERAKQLGAALADGNIRGIVLHIDSPGGEVNGCGELADIIFNARGTKPIVAYVGGEACSAGYWLASAADRIVAYPTAMVGSIGVRATLTDTTKRDEMEGVQRRTIVSSGAPKKAMLDKVDDAAAAELQTILDGLEARFVTALARNRGVGEEVIRSDFGQGGVLIAGAAGANARSGFDAGLVDELGSLESVLASMGVASPAVGAPIDAPPSEPESPAAPDEEEEPTAPADEEQEETASEEEEDEKQPQPRKRSTRRAEKPEEDEEQSAGEQEEEEEREQARARTTSPKPAATSENLRRENQQLSARVKQLEAARTKAEVEALVAQGVANRTIAQSQTAAFTQLGHSDLTALRNHVQNSTPIPTPAPGGSHRQPTPTGVGQPTAANGKTWAEMKPAERAALYLTNRPLYDALKAAAQRA